MPYAGRGGAAPSDAGDSLEADSSEVDSSEVDSSEADSSGADGSEAVDAQSAPDPTCTGVLVGDVSISEPSGTFQGILSVQLATVIPGAEIRYTMDGTAPSASSSLYESALAISNTTRLRVSAFVNGQSSGRPSTALYVARAIDATHDIPVIVLDSYGSGALSTADADREFADVAFLAFDRTSDVVSIASAPTVASLAAFHVRGNSSALFDKLSYHLELRNESGDDRDCPVLGMPAESDWALVGPHADKTLVHNHVVYDLGRAIGMQTPRLRLADVYVNLDGGPLSADDYQGVYQVVETIKNQKNRLDLKQLDETQISDTQISGGYIFKFEWMITRKYALECPFTAANCWKAMELVDPLPIAPVQKDWLTQHLVAFNDALHGIDPANEVSGYPSFIEPKSFIDMVIVTEFTRNMDAYVRSQYFFKDRDGKINAGPLWDYDLIAGVGLSATGYASAMANIPIEGWEYQSNASRLAGATADWFPILIANPAFKAQLIARWKELRAGPLSDTAVAARIDALSQGLANAAERNFQKWSILSQSRVGPFETPTEGTWAGQIDYMKTWLQRRGAWIDGKWQ